MNLEGGIPLPRNANEQGYDLQRVAREKLPEIEHDFLHIDGQDTEALKTWFGFLQATLDNPENYIDHGGAATVFSINETICIKMIANRHDSEYANLMNLGNTAQFEANIQARLNIFKEAGVRSPQLIMYIEGEKYHGVIMEKLNAVNLQKCLNGEQTFPELFNPEEFCFDLEEYLYALHDIKDLSHGDLYARNVMIDNVTGKPIVIDFGRSKFKNNQLKKDDLLRLQEITLALTKK